MLCALGCAAWAPFAFAQQAPTPPRPPAITRVGVDTGEYKGLSDLTVDDEGRYWSAPERQRAILRLRLAGAKPGLAAAPIALVGVPEGTDTEAMAWLSDTQFVFGTETQEDKRPSDDLLFATLENGRATVTRKVPMPYKLWNMVANTNEGIEGVCVAAGLLLASCESAMTRDGKRYAAIGRYDLRHENWTPFTLQLTSRLGIISALSCRVDKATQSLDVVALERYIGVSHVLRFRVPKDGPGTTIVPDVMVDLGRAMDAVPNIEGVARSPEGDLYIISDNDYGVVTGPTQWITIPRDWR